MLEQPKSQTVRTAKGPEATDLTHDTESPATPNQSVSAAGTSNDTHNETPDAAATHEDDGAELLKPMTASQDHSATQLVSSQPLVAPQPPFRYQHAPFILAYGARILAEQLTIIEVAALAEIEWQDLVDMKWSNDQNPLDWAEFIHSGTQKGIDMVIARFNLAVKWIVSEIVLTRDLIERARTISKFIRIAVEARRLRNFSTMVQITIALSSGDCLCLKGTWALVDDASRQALEEMEALVQPLRNFRDLRLEMESQGLHEGCAPFVGLYVQDLTYNAQKPSLIEVEGGTQPLVNLEKYRTAASIAKSLLRLIDASTRYNFTPVKGIIERCLWVSCLKDDEIRALSNSLEP
ncbi:Guanine nucleotide exchange factor lte1 [Ascosphaera acerosa]|nr:Guanine nucleotide exchange factor lte1 [Ascosphaera acerosa]